jgi:LPS sulfotransferase NodH
MSQGASSPKKNNQRLTTLKKLLLNCKALPKSGIYFIKERLGKVKPVKSKLVLVISFPRSGTHALGSLVSQENIGFRYHGEFFAFNHWSSVIERLNRYYPFFSFRFYLNFKTQRQKWRTYRFESSSLSATRTIRAMKKIHGIHIIKVFPTHLSDPVLESIIAEHKPHIIFLRRNHLDRFVSHKKANKTGKWHTTSTEGVEIDIDETELKKFIDEYEKFYSRYIHFAREQGCAVLDVDYELLQDAKVIEEIQHFSAWEGFTDFNKLAKIPTTAKQDSSRTVQDKYLKAAGKKISDFDFKKIEAN